MKNLEGKTAVISGAASGMGRATALSMATRGVNVVLVDLNGDGLAETAALAEAKGAAALPLTQDIGQSDAFDKIHEAAGKRFGQVDILMNNAAILCSGSLEDIPMTQWELMVNVNILAMVRACKLFAPEMIARGSGHIVNTCSFSALYPYSVDRMPYVTTKAAVKSFTEGLALYLKPKGVGVTLLLPGPVSTGMGSRSTRFSAISTAATTGSTGFQSPGSEFPWKTPEEVGEMVVGAIETDTFFLPTDFSVMAKIQTFAADPEAFIKSQIALMSGG